MILKQLLPKKELPQLAEFVKKNGGGIKEYLKHKNIGKVSNY